MFSRLVYISGSILNIFYTKIIWPLMYTAQLDSEEIISKKIYAANVQGSVYGLPISIICYNGRSYVILQCVFSQISVLRRSREKYTFKPWTTRQIIVYKQYVFLCLKCIQTVQFGICHRMILLVI